MSIARQNKIGNDLKKNGKLGGKEMQREISGRRE